MRNIILFGPPGAGKGTQSQHLVQKYQLKHIAPGDLMRAQISRGTALGQQVAQYMNAGKLVPDTLVTAIVLKEITIEDNLHGFLFDGFPRTTVQAQKLEEHLARHRLKVDALISIKVPEEALIQRIRLRSQTSGRPDDQDEQKIATRMQLYAEETMPVAQYYLQRALYYEVDGTGSVASVSARIEKVLAKLAVNNT